MDITKEFKTLLEIYETLLADPDIERKDFIIAEEQAFRHFYSIIDFVRQEERERARKIIDDCPDEYCEEHYNFHSTCDVCIGMWKQEAIKKLNETA